MKAWIQETRRRLRPPCHVSVCSGFSLLELMVVTVTLSIVSVIGFAALQNATSSVNMSTAKSEALTEVRDVLAAMIGELQLARKNNVETSDTYIRINKDPVRHSPIEIVFQVPSDNTGDNYSTPITFRYVDEDSNGNGFLDIGEDVVVADRSLSRKIVRLQEVLDADGNLVATARPVGGANSIDDVDFRLDGDTLTIEVTATRVVPGSRYVDKATQEPRDLRISESLSGRVYLTN